MTLLQKLASRGQKITDFDTLDISGIKIFRQGRKTFHEQCEPDEADYWSVFGHLRRGGLDDFRDFRTQAQAEKYHHQLLKRYPHLRKFQPCARPPVFPEAGAWRRSLQTTDDAIVAGFIRWLSSMISPD
jgi:hypothetical protein